MRNIYKISVNNKRLMKEFESENIDSEYNDGSKYDPNPSKPN